MTDYLLDTKSGCEKDPSFIKERNLITYAVELMMQSNNKYISGLRILASILIKWREAAKDKDDWERLQGQQILIKQLIGSPSSSSNLLLLKLLHTLHPRNPYGGGGMGMVVAPARALLVGRLDAARIVAHLAGEIRLSQFPGTIQCIASLLDACQRQQDGDGDRGTIIAAGEFIRLMEEGLNILEGLASDEENCKIIISTHGLLSKIMMPAGSDLLHRIGHDVQWVRNLVDMSLSVISELAAAPGDTGKDLRSKISNDKEAIASIDRIIGCSGCAQHRRSVVLGIKILKQLCNESSSSTSMDAERTGNLVNRLSDIFTTVNMDISIRKSAAEALLASLQSSRNATLILEANDSVLHVLTSVLLNDDVESDTSYRLIAAQILEHLSVHYPKDDDDHLIHNLKEAMTHVMPKVLRKILRCESTAENGAQMETEAEKVNSLSLAPPAPDIENGEIVPLPQDNALQNITSSSRQQDEKKQNESRTLLAALLSLCVVICDTFIAADQDLAHKLEQISPGDSQFSFPRKLKEMAERHNQPTVDCLRITKHTCRMVTSMLKHSGRYDNGDMESLMKYISDASSKGVAGAEVLMIMASRDSVSEKHTGATLASLVEEAQELLKKKKNRGNRTDGSKC